MSFSSLPFYELRILSAVNIFSCGLEALRCLWMLGCNSRVFWGKQNLLQRWSVDSFTEGFSFCIQSTTWAPQSQWGCRGRLRSWVWLLMAAHILCLKHTLLPERLDRLNSSECHQNTDSEFLKQVISLHMLFFLSEAFNTSPFFLPFSVAFNHLSPDHQNSVEWQRFESEFSVTHKRDLVKLIQLSVSERREREAGAG